MATDKVRKYVLPNIPYLFIGWFCLKIGTAYRLAAGAGFGEKLLGLGQTIGAAFGSFAPGLAPLDWFVGAGLLVHRHHRSTAQKAAHFHRVPHVLARGGQQADSGGLVVHHADGRLVRDDGGDGLRRGVAGHGDHIQTHGANAGHGL